MKTDYKIVAIIVVGFLLFMTIIVGGAILDDRNKSADMHACVASGGSWVQQHGDYFNCEQP